MPAPLLLVDDDLATIAQVKRVLAREGYEMVLATNAADAVIAWGHHLPPLVLISPRVESDRGRVVLEELRGHPDAKLLHVLLLGETIPGFGYPVAPLPLDAEAFAQTVNELVQGTTSSDGWQVHVAPSTRTDEFPAVVAGGPAEPDSWRATRTPSAPGRSDAPSEAVAKGEPPEPPEPGVATLFSTPDAAPPPREESVPPELPASGDLESALFGDLEAQVAREVEAQAMASVDASLAQLPLDQELQDLEDDVRAEAARRREHRRSAAVPAVGLPTPDRAPDPVAAPPAQEDAFTGFDEPTRPAPGPAAAAEATARDDDALAARLAAESERARATLKRAEQIAFEATVAHQATGVRAAARAAELELEREAARAALEASEARAKSERAEREQEREAAEAQAQSERAARQRVEQELEKRGAASEGESKQLGSEVERLKAELAEQAQLRLEASTAAKLEQTQAKAQLQSHAEASAALEIELVQLKGQLQSASVEAGARDEEVARLKGQLKSASGEAFSLEEEVARLKALLQSGKEESLSRAEELARLEALVQRDTEASASRDDELARLKAQLLARDAALAESQARGERQSEAEDARDRELKALAGALTAAEASRVETLDAAESLAARLAQARQRVGELESSLERAGAERAALNAQSDELSAAAKRAAGELREAIEEAEQSEERAQSEAATNAEALAAARGETLGAQQRSAEAEAGLQKLGQEVERLRSSLTAAQLAERKLEEALEDARAANLEVRTRADEAEAKARALEAKSVLPLKIPHRPPLGVQKYGTVELGELARLVGQVVLARAELRIELAAPGGRRTIWLSRGAVVAAESTFGGESLLDRARRDGLIDSRQTAELQLVRSASPAETISVLKERGFLREAEVVPLVQRYTEQVALDAFSEPTSEYRLTEEGPGNQTLAATLPRPTLPLVAEALRRALPVEELLQRLGGSAAVPVAIESELDLRALGFSDKERRMLGYCDAEANVEDLALASGLRADAAFRALLVAKLLGLIELKVPARTSAAPAVQLDEKRLEAKFEQVQEADYFTMLGLGRAAGADEVRRAWQRLADEFDPIRYSGHPDAGLQQRAQVVYAVLEEAAKALGDDRRRADYARHLID